MSARRDLKPDFDGAKGLLHSTASAAASKSSLHQHTAQMSGSRVRGGDSMMAALDMGSISYGAGDGTATLIASPASSSTTSVSLSLQSPQFQRRRTSTTPTPCSSRAIHLSVPCTPILQAHNQLVNTHIFTSTRNFPTVFDEALLEAVEYCGFGSWKNISERLKQSLENPLLAPINPASPDQVQRYYLTVFSPHFKNLTNEYNFSVTSTAATGQRSNQPSTRSKNRKLDKEILPFGIVSPFRNSESLGGTSGTQEKCAAYNFVNVNHSQEPRTDVVHSKAIPLATRTMLSYKRLRGDFEMEFDDTAEEFVADLTDEIEHHTEARSEYTPLLKRMRLALCDSYVRYRLHERHRRKRVLQEEHGIDDLDALRDGTSGVHKELGSCIQISHMETALKLSQDIQKATKLRERIKALEQQKLTQANTAGSPPLQSMAEDSNNNLPGHTRASFSETLLSKQEQSICRRSQISPAKYTTLKTQCLLQAAQLSDTACTELVKLNSTAKERKLVNQVCHDNRWSTEAHKLT